MMREQQVTTEFVVSAKLMFAFIFLLFNLADAGKYYVSVFKDNYEQCQSC